MPTIDFPTIDLSKIKPPFALPFDLPTIELPSFDFAGVDVPRAEQVLEWTRDAVFAGTGLVALAAERVAGWQKQVTELVTSQLKR